MRAQTIRGASVLLLVGGLILGAVAIFAPKLLVAVVVLFVTLAALTIGSALWPVSATLRASLYGEDRAQPGKISDAGDSREGEELSRTRDSAGG
jgi:hypothetical protein